MRTRPSPATLLATLALVVAAGIPAGHAVAAALTPHSVKKLAKKVADKEIAKKAGGLSVSHASTASDADALGGVLPTGFQRKGAITMSFAASGWVDAQPTAVTVYRMPNQTQLSATTGLQLFAYPIAAPVQLGGAPVTLTSVRYCYAGATGVHVTSERLEQVDFEGGAGVVGATVTHSLDLGDDACRTFSVNVVLGPHDQISLEVGATWTTGGATLRLGAVTATFSPS